MPRGWTDASDAGRETCVILFCCLKQADCEKDPSDKRSTGQRETTSHTSWLAWEGDKRKKTKKVEHTSAGHSIASKSHHNHWHGQGFLWLSGAVRAPASAERHGCEEQDANNHTIPGSEAPHHKMYKCIPVVDAFIQMSVSLWWPSTRSCRVWRWQRDLSTLPLIAVFGQVGPCCLLALRMQPEEMRKAQPGSRSD